MAISGTTVLFLTSFSAIPISYILNRAHGLNQAAVLGTGILALLVVTVVPYLYTRYTKAQKTDAIYYALGIFTFSSVIDIIIALENDGFIENFTLFYIREGEPYLKTAHGTMICYWDGIAHYGMYITMLVALSWNQNYSEVGLFWVGSIVHSMLVFIPGNIAGKFGVKGSILLNIPYFIVPVWIGVRFLQSKSSVQLTITKSYKQQSIFRRPVDFLFIIYFVAAAGFACFRGFAVLGCDSTMTENYLKDFEPYLKDSSAYPKMQMLVYMYYFVPYYAFAIYGLLFPGCMWMLPWALLHAGAAAQAQFSHIGSSLHYRTPYILRVPHNSLARTVFWVTNLALMVVPQLFVAWCLYKPEFFCLKISNDLVEGKKKNQMN